MGNTEKRKFCTNCGKPLPVGARFCEECGTPVEKFKETSVEDMISVTSGDETIKNDNVPLEETVKSSMSSKHETEEEKRTERDSDVNVGENQESNLERNSNPEPERVIGEVVRTGSRNRASAVSVVNKPKKGLLIGLIVLAAVVISLVFVFSNHKKTINIENYVTYEFDGYDTEGTAVVSIDYDALESAVMPTMERKLEKVTEKYESELQSWYYGGVEPDGISEDELDLLYAYHWNEDISYYLASVTADTTSNLSNGDEITITIEYDNDLLEKYGIKFTGESMTVTVADLKEAEVVDVFAELEVTFSGVSPHLSTGWFYDVTPDALDGQYVTVTCDPYENLKIGDKVTLTVDTENFPDGYVPLEDTKVITVGDADKYIEELEEIPDELWYSLETQAEDVMIADFAENNGTEEVLDDVEYQGAYLLTPKVEDSEKYATKLYLVFKANVTNPAGSLSYYWYIAWSNPILHTDGTAEVSNLLDAEYPSYNYSWSNFPDTYIASGDYKYAGYESMDILYTENIAVEMDEYNVETDLTETE